MNARERAEARTEERRRLLGDDVIAAIHARVAEAPPAPPELIARLRPILARPGGRSPQNGSRARA